MFNVLTCIATEHDWRLVVLAALVCLPATIATFFLFSRATSTTGWARFGWLAATGMVAGSGIWTTHFVAMLAFKTGLPTGYAALNTIASMGVAVLSTAAGFAVATQTARKPAVATGAGGLIVGLGITAMHYVGMSGYRTAGHLVWDGAYVLASVVVGGLLAAAAMAAARRGRTLATLSLAGGLLSLGIVGMHFTGMTAVTIVPDGTIVVPASVLSEHIMVFAAVAVTGIILVIAVGAVAFDSVNRNAHLRRLREALDVMPEGLAFYDANEKLVAWNNQYAALCRAAGAELEIGMAFSDLLDREINHGLYPDVSSRKGDWQAQREAARSKGGAGLTQRTSSGRWLRITDRRTADGGMVSVSVDITDLKAAELAMAEARDKATELARRADVAEAIAGVGHWRRHAKTNELNWSPQMYLIYGLDPSTPLEIDQVLAMTHPDDAAGGRARRLRQLESGRPEEGAVVRIMRANGELRFLSTKSSVETDAEGAVVAFVGTVIDITEQKLAEMAVAESEERFRRLAVNAPDMIAESQIDGTLTYMSPASTAITGFSPEELIGRTAFSLMDSEGREAVQAMCDTVMGSGGAVAPWPVEFRATHKDGRELWLECKPVPATDPVTGRFTGFNDVIRDVTPRKALEAQLRLAQAEAEAAATVKADFLANMSHELRTPLTSILGFTSLAAEQSDLTPLTREYVERVSDASRALMCTVNDILDFSKLEAGQVSITPQPVGLARLARSTLDLFTPQAAAKDLSLTFDGDDDDLTLSLDPDRIRQVLLNLVSNAVKFTDRGGVTLKARYVAGSQTLEVEVIDTGAGIPTDKQGRLFQRFSQIDGSLSRAQAGTGLGLAICKGLVEAMGGEIGVSSVEGAGSRFWFRLNAPEAELASADAFGGEEHLSVAGLRVLVVDDHPANRELARLFLAGVGAEVAEAEDGERAVAMAMDLPYDVILMDIRMPNLDGPGALRRIRETGGPNDVTPVVAFTADADTGLVPRLLSMGFEGHVAKPLEPGNLITAVARAAFQPPMQEVADVG